jgi:hypothetical protein
LNLSGVREAPYVSIVVTARNDDHGGNLLRRMQAFVNGVLIQSERHRVRTELILVEWNPVADRPSLADALDWKLGSEYCDIRIIPVPAELHQRLIHWQALPLFQMIAKNVGIRRAAGEFVLATNIDILFSNELFRFFAEKRLESGKMYRVDRWDVMEDVPVERPFDEQLEWCNSHLIRVCRREGTFPLNPDGTPKIDAVDIVRPGCGITLGENWFQREMSGEEPFRWVENDAELRIENPSKYLLLEVEPGPGVDNSPFELELRDVNGNAIATVVVERRTTFHLALSGVPRIVLHTDGGGMQIPTDLRILNFRVFRCELAEEPLPLRTEIVRNPGGRFKRAAQALRGSLFSGADIRIPMSQESLAKLAVHQDGGGVSFHLGPLLGAGPGEIVGGGLAAIWESGFYDAEYFKRERFRWMQRKGTVTFVFPEPAEAIELDVEAGPAVGYRQAKLEIRDESGKVLASTTLDKRTTVEVPLGDLRGSVRLDLSISSDLPPREIARDPRVLALRVIRCRLKPESAGPALHATEATPGAGIWCIRNVKAAASGLVCRDHALLAIRSRDSMTLEVAPQYGSSKVAIRDAYGNTYYDGVLPGRKYVELKKPGISMVVLEISASHPVTISPVVRIPETGTIVGTLRQKRSHAQLHTNACGDFTMMAREHWLDLRGYPEFDAFSMNIDSVFCWAAHHGGAREEVLPFRIFHIEHATGSGWTPEGERALYERIRAKGLPWIEFSDVMSWARTMNKFDLPMIFNREHWGFGGEELREVRPEGCLRRNVSI